MTEDRLSIKFHVGKSVFNEIASISTKDNRTIPKLVETMILISLKKISYRFTNIKTYQKLIIVQKKYIEFLAEHLDKYEAIEKLRSGSKTNNKVLLKATKHRNKIQYRTAQLKPKLR